MKSYENKTMRSIYLIYTHFDKHEQKTAYWHQYARQVKTRILPSLSQATRVCILSGRSDSGCERERATEGGRER